MRTNCLVLAIALSIAAAGCHNKRVPIVTTLPPPAPAPSTVAAPPPAPEPLPPPPVAPEPKPSPVDIANRAISAGNYEQAARELEHFIASSSPGDPHRDQALFDLGWMYAVRSPSGDWQKVTALFKQLVDESPESPFKAPASLILSLRTQVDRAGNDIKQRDQRIKQLTTELDLLKKIDADRRKRP